MIAALCFLLNLFVILLKVPVISMLKKVTLLYVTVCAVTKAFSTLGWRERERFPSGRAPVSNHNAARTHARRVGGISNSTHRGNVNKLEIHPAISYSICLNQYIREFIVYLCYFDNFEVMK